MLEIHRADPRARRAPSPRWARRSGHLPGPPGRPTAGADFRLPLPLHHPGHGCATRGRHYTPWDTKLARSAKPYFLVQLCAYADMLEAISGFRPGELVFMLGQGATAFPTRHFFHYYRQLRRSFLAFQGAGPWATCPIPGSTGAGAAGRRPPSSSSKTPIT